MDNKLNSTLFMQFVNTLVYFVKKKQTSTNAKLAVPASLRSGMPVDSNRLCQYKVNSKNREMFCG